MKWKDPSSSSPAEEEEEEEGNAESRGPRKSSEDVKKSTSDTGSSSLPPIPFSLSTSETSAHILAAARIADLPSLLSNSSSPSPFPPLSKWVRSAMSTIVRIDGPHFATRESVVDGSVPRSRLYNRPVTNQLITQLSRYGKRKQKNVGGNGNGSAGLTGSRRSRGSWAGARDEVDALRVLQPSLPFLSFLSFRRGASRLNDTAGVGAKGRTRDDEVKIVAVCQRPARTEPVVADAGGEMMSSLDIVTFFRGHILPQAFWYTRSRAAGFVTRRGE